MSLQAQKMNLNAFVDDHAKEKGCEASEKGVEKLDVQSMPENLNNVWDVEEALHNEMLDNDMGEIDAIGVFSILTQDGDFEKPAEKRGFR